MSNPSLRNFAFAAALALAAGAVLAPTGAQAHHFGGGWGHHGGGHWGGHWGHHWGYGPRFVYGGDCFLKRYVNDYGELVVRRVCY